MANWDSFVKINKNCVKPSHLRNTVWKKWKCKIFHTYSPINIKECTMLKMVSLCKEKEPFSL